MPVFAYLWNAVKAITITLNVFSRFNWKHIGKYKVCRWEASSVSTFHGWLFSKNRGCCCSVTKSCPTLWDPVDHSTPGSPVLHCLLEFAQTRVHWVGDAIQPAHPLSSPSPPALNLSQHQGLFQWVNSSHEVAKVLDFQLQHQSFQWTPRTDLL